MSAFSQEDIQDSLRLRKEFSSVQSDGPASVNLGKEDTQSIIEKLSTSRPPDAKGPIEINSNIVPKKRGRQAKYEGAQHPHLLDKAKDQLTRLNYDMKKLLELEEFAALKGSPDVAKFLNKFVLNKVACSQLKSVRSCSQIDPEEIRLPKSAASCEFREEPHQRWGNITEPD